MPISTSASARGRSAKSPPLREPRRAARVFASVHLAAKLIQALP